VVALQDEPEIHTLGKGFATWLQQALPHKHLDIGEEIQSLEGLHDMFKENMDAYWERVQQDATRVGLKEGRERGHKEGVEQGRTEGQRVLISKLLNIKFGSNPERADVLAELDMHALERIAELILTAITEQDLFNAL
jgi:flagellar biosynthesis/type III secretory pathway protein FliH